MKNLSYKIYFMRRNSSISILLISMFFFCPNSGLPHDQIVRSAAHDHSKERILNIQGESTQSHTAIPVAPVTQTEEHTKKPHLLKTDELAHIHHFHKERVKKMKRHHKKIWMMSKILLILSHLVLLICAYMHSAH